ncbi:MAG: hypothetical protein ACYTFX_12740, partial [Planctomycetota bacterium]
EKENQVSIPEKVAVLPLTQAPVEPNLVPLVPEPNEPALPAAEATASAEPLESVAEQLFETPSVTEETPGAETAPTELTEPVPEPNEPARSAAEATASTESLESVARRLLEISFMAEETPGAETPSTELTEPVPEPNEPAGETPEASSEDFLSEGLLRELDEAEQKDEVEQPSAKTAVTEMAEAIQPKPTETESPAVDANEPAREEISEDESIKILQALMAQARAEEEQTA